MSVSSYPNPREALKALVADKRYWDFNHPEHDAYVAHVTGEFKRVYPGPYVPGSSYMHASDPDGGAAGSVHVRAYSRVQDGNVVQVSDYDRAAPGRGAGDTSERDSGKIIDRAGKWVGTPYATKSQPLSGKNARMGEGADCSGSVHAIYSEAGKDYKYVNSSAFPEAARKGEIPFREIKPEEAQPGDVLVWPGHMSIEAGNGDIFTASSSGKEYARTGKKWFIRELGQPRYYRYQEGSRV